LGEPEGKKIHFLCLVLIKINDGKSCRNKWENSITKKRHLKMRGNQDNYLRRDYILRKIQTLMGL